MQRLDWKEAISAYSELNRNDPLDEQAAQTLVELFFKINKPELALGTLDQFFIAMVRNNRGTRIEPILLDLVEQRPNEPGLVNRLARLYTTTDKRDEAVHILDRLGELQLEDNDRIGAIQTIEAIIQLEPENVDTYIQLLDTLREGVN